MKLLRQRNMSFHGEVVGSDLVEVMIKMPTLKMEFEMAADLGESRALKLRVTYLPCHTSTKYI